MYVYGWFQLDAVLTREILAMICWQTAGVMAGASTTITSAACCGEFFFIERGGGLTTGEQRYLRRGATEKQHINGRQVNISAPAETHQLRIECSDHDA